MAKRIISEKKINSNKFNLKIGTTNRTNPLVVYIEGRTFISPLLDKEDYNSDIFDLKHALKSCISKELCQTALFENKYIIDFQVASSGIAVNKKSFLSFQFFLKQNKNSILMLKELKDSSENMINAIVNSLEENILKHDFIISKTKKQ